MTGVFGLIDPQGIDERSMLEAARSVEYRGTPMLIHDGAAALGVFQGQGAELVRTPTSLLAFDGRVDAYLGSAMRFEEPGPPGRRVDALIEARGVDGLDDLAADFALARLDRQRSMLTLARDGFGLRPLFWARRGRRFGFASDPRVLVELDLASGKPDLEMYLMRVACQLIPGNRTGFEGTFRVPGGRWMTIELSGRLAGGRWFRPESIDGVSGDLEAFAARFRECLLAAVRSRARTGPIALSLSGGRDSGSLALALAEAGVDAQAITYDFDEELGCSEAHLAAPLARAVGMSWTSARVPDRVSREELARLPTESGTPFSPVAFPIGFAVLDAALRIGARTIIDGEGGDLLGARPMVLLDLLRRGRLAKAARAARGFQRHMGMSSELLARWVARALSPAPVLTWRDRRRGVPPWVVNPPPTRQRDREPRTARQDLISNLIRSGEFGPDEPWERMLALRGMAAVSPLLDLRVVRCILSMPTELQAPDPGLKPLLRTAFLGRWDDSRTKAVQTRYFSRLASGLLADHGHLFGQDSHLVRTGLVRPISGGLPIAARSMDPLYLVGPESWLQAHE